MKRGQLLLTLLLSLVMVTTVVGCSMVQAGTTVPDDVVPVVEQATNTVVAEGVVEPARRSELHTDQGLTVIQVPVAVGDAVFRDDLLVQLDPTDAKQAVRQAEAALALAQATLMQVRAGARPEEIAVTEAQLEAAEAAHTQATAQLNRLSQGEAAVDVASAQAAHAAALATQIQSYNAHEQTLKCFNVKMPDGSNKTICPMLGPTEEQARDAWHAAEDELAAAEARLRAAQSGAGARVRDASAGVGQATAQVDALAARLDLQKAGSTSAQIAAAEADVSQARVALEAARAALEDTAIRAPFDGTVVAVNVDPGETAVVGEILVTLATLDRLRVRTEDLTELDVVRLAVGQPAVVTLDALPDRPLSGHVARIDKQSQDYRGDVTYPVIVELDEDLPELRWGLTALVEIDVE